MSDEWMEGRDPRPMPRIACFEPLDGRRARVRWKGTQAAFDVDLASALSTRKVFAAALQNDDVFRSAAISEFEDSVSFGGDAELSAVWIRRLAEEQGVLSA